MLNLLIIKSPVFIFILPQICHTWLETNLHIQIYEDNVQSRLIQKISRYLMATRLQLQLLICIFEAETINTTNVLTGIPQICYWRTVIHLRHYILWIKLLKKQKKTLKYAKCIYKTCRLDLSCSQCGMRPAWFWIQLFFISVVILRLLCQTYLDWDDLGIRCAVPEGQDGFTDWRPCFIASEFVILLVWLDVCYCFCHVRLSFHFTDTICFNLAFTQFSVWRCSHSRFSADLFKR